MHTIKLFRLGRYWYAQFSDPAVLEAMGTDRLQTPYTRDAFSDTVLATIRELNRDCLVSLEERQT